MKTLIKNGTIVSGSGTVQGDVRMDGERISELGCLNPQEGEAIIDAEGCLLFPGFIDTHTHFDMDNGVTTTADDFASGTMAAVAGGTTCVLDFATQEKNETLAQGLENWKRKTEGKCSCDYGFHMAVTNWNETTDWELDRMKEEGITSFKLYMAYDNLRLDDGAIYAVLKRLNEIGGLAGIHCENGDLIQALTKEQLARGHTGPQYHPVSKPHEIEAEAVNRVLAIAKLAGAPVNIVHTTCRDALDAVRRARAERQTVFVETCPQYLLLDESRYQLQGNQGFEPAKYVFSPPLRGKAHQEALWQAIKQNEINTIGTDHCSFNYEGQKEIGRKDFSKIPNGIPGVEHRPVLLYTYGVETGKITIEQMAALLSENAAKLFGMYPRKGCIAVGSDADIVVWDPKAAGKISAATQLQNVDYTPYEGMETKGEARYVFLRGRKVAEKGEILLKGQGTYIPRGASGKVSFGGINGAGR